MYYMYICIVQSVRFVDSSSNRQKKPPPPPLETAKRKVWKIPLLRSNDDHLMGESSEPSAHLL